MNQRRGWRTPSQPSVWLLLGIGVAALALFLGGARLAGATHYDAATIQAVDECEPATEAATPCRVTLGGVADTAGAQPIPDEIGAFEIELWGGGGGGGGGGSEPAEGGGGGGGGGGGYAAITLVRGAHFDDGDCIEFSVGEGGEGGMGARGAPNPDAADAGTDGTASTVTIYPDCGSTGTAYSAGGGAGGGDGVLPLHGGDGGTGGAGGTGDRTGGTGGTGDGIVSGGGGGGGSAFHDGNGENGTDGTRQISPDASVGGTGGDGTGPGGDGGRNVQNPDTGSYVPEDATQGEFPGGGGGGGTYLARTWSAPAINARDGADGAEGVILATWYALCEVAPCVTKTAQTSANGEATWLIAVENLGANAQAVRIEDADVAFFGYGAGNTSGGVCDPAEFDANDQIECDVPAEGSLELLVTRDLISCTETTADNSLDGFEWWDGGSWVALGYPDDVVTTTVPADTDDCWQPTVAKTGLETGRRFTWEIEIDNRPPDSSALEAVDVRVRLTDPFVSLVSWADGGCTQSGSAANRVIECDVAADEELRFLVWREAPEPTCESQYDWNSISLIEVASDLGGGYGPFEDFGPGPQEVRAELHRGEGSCLPPWYQLPVPDPDPADPPSGDEPGCDLEQATWSPDPASLGFTISRWGGGNVDEFPAPVATSYWTTVDGELIGYIPGAPAWVNSEFFAAFSDGEIPACAAFIVVRR